MISTIFIPTDFSACASNAVNAGILLAEMLEADVHLYHCLSVPEKWKELTPRERKEYEEVQQRTENAKILLQNIALKFPQVRIETEIYFENPLPATEKIVKDKNAMVVMGSHGTSGKSEYFIGSQTQKVVRSVHCPVLVIKEPLQTFPFKKVVFASAFNEEDKDAFREFLEFIKLFAPDIHLVYIASNSIFETPVSVAKEAMEDFEALAEGLSCKTHYFRDFTVEAGIRHFSDEIKADLVVVSNHNRRPIRRMLIGSTVEALVNHCSQPVLSWDYMPSLE